LDGRLVPLRYSTLEAEVAALRAAAGLSVLPHLTCLRLAGKRAHAVLDAICPTSLPRTSGILCQGLLLHEDGRPFADVYVGNDDDGFLLVAEGPLPGAVEGY